MAHSAKESKLSTFNTKEITPMLTVENFVSRRKALGLTQKDIAKITGRSKATIEAWEQNISPIPKEMGLVLAALEYIRTE